MIAAEISQVLWPISVNLLDEYMMPGACRRHNRMLYQVLVTRGSQSSCVEVVTPDAQGVQSAQWNLGPATQ